MHKRRAHELRREIRRTLATCEVDEWVARELQRTTHRLRVVERGERKARRREARAEEVQAA